jgi:hypothetical protein
LKSCIRQHQTYVPLVQVLILKPTSGTRARKLVDSISQEQQQVYLDETKGQAFLDTTSSADDHLECWYLNMGAMNHMTSRSEVFSELDRAVQGAVKFGDGSIINICE